MISEWIHQGTQFLITTINEWGYWGIFVLMALESSIVPVPSELVMIPAGAGNLNLLGAFIVGTLGSLVGALGSYYLAFILGRKGITLLTAKYGKFFLIGQKSLLKSEQFFSKHGEITIFTGRLLPVVRHLISLPAGFGKMSLMKFCAYTLLGAGIWNAILLSLGVFYKTNQELLNQYLSEIVFGTIVAAVLVWALYFWLKRKKESKARCAILA